MPDEILVDAINVQKIYHMGKIDAQALRGVSLQVRQGDFLTIVGPSGSGKTTLLNLIGALGWHHESLRPRPCHTFQTGTR